MVTIKKVETKNELKKFIRFNYELYKNNPYSVPDLYEDMLTTFSDKNLRLVVAIHLSPAARIPIYPPRQGPQVGVDTTAPASMNAV